MRFRHLAPLLLLLLAGCSGGADEAGSEQEPSSSTTEPCPSGGAGEYRAPDGRVSVQLYGAGRDVDELDALAARVDVDGLSFASVTLDNSDGTEPLTVGAVAVVTDAGERVDFVDSLQAIGSWQDRVASNDSDLYNDMVDAYNARLNSDTALGGEKRTSTFVASTRPASVKGVVVDGTRICKI